MRVDVFPMQVKQNIIEHLQTSKYQDVNTWAEFLSSNDSSEYYADFRRYTDQHDLYRHTNFAETFPELERVINGVQ